jgi:hypothetical protein
MPEKTKPDPGDTEARAEAAFAEIQAQIDMPPPPHVRNINLDTHVGYYPQRPHAALEDRLGAFTHGPRSFEDLAASLPDGEEIEQDENGEWVRYVPVHRETAKDADGNVVNVLEDVPRYVALTMEAARAATAAGRETDWWSGFTWMRRGYKPEKDLHLAAPARAPRLRVERANPIDAAAYERRELHQAAVDVVPRLSDAGKAADTRKEK